MLIRKHNFLLCLFFYPCAEFPGMGLRRTGGT